MTEDQTPDAKDQAAGHKKSIVLEVQNIRHVLSLNIKHQAPKIAPDKENETHG